MTRRKPSRDVLADNVRRLLEGQGQRVAQGAIRKAGGPAQASIGRLLNTNTAPNLRSLDEMAKFFGVEAWQLLIADLDIRNPPRLVRGQANEQEFHRRVAELAAEMGIERRRDH